MDSLQKQPTSNLDPSMWVDRDGDALYRYALARLRDPEAAEEVVQETFVSALRAVEQYSGQGAQGAGLRNVVDHVRRRSRFQGLAAGQADSGVKLSPEARARTEAARRDSTR